MSSQKSKPSIDTDCGRYRNAARAAPVSGRFHSTKYSSPSEMSHFMTPDEFIKSRSSDRYLGADDIVEVSPRERENTSSPTTSTMSSQTISSQASTAPTSAVPVSASQRSEPRRSLEDIEEEHTPTICFGLKRLGSKKRPKDDMGDEDQERSPKRLRRSLSWTSWFRSEK